MGHHTHLSSGDIAQVNLLYDYCPARLRIYANSGYNLPDTDGYLQGDSDPYMVFVAYDLYGGSLRWTTSVDQDDNSPEWWQWFDFGTRVWTRFTVNVWDADVGPDDALSDTHTFYIFRGPRQNLLIN